MIFPLAQMQEASRALADPLFAGLPGDCEISFEFFPPRTAKGSSKLLATAEQFATVNPSFFSVTFIDSLSSFTIF